MIVVHGMPIGSRFSGFWWHGHPGRVFHIHGLEARATGPTCKLDMHLGPLNRGLLVKFAVGKYRLVFPRVSQRPGQLRGLKTGPARFVQAECL